MGIPGLTRAAAKKYLVRRGPEFLTNGEFHIDGYNFALQLLHHEQLSLGPFLKRLREQLMLLLELRPISVVFYLDGFLPEEKIAVRTERKASRIKKTKFETPICIGELCILVLHDSFPQIKTVITNIEADDAIANAISRSDHACRKFIFSDDSDMLTFILPNANTINVVPLAYSYDWPDRYACYNLDRAQNSSLIQSYFRRPMPSIGWQVENPEYPILRMVEFVNIAQRYGRPAFFLPILPCIDILDPYQLGVYWRAAAYFFMCKKNGLNFDFVYEYQQKGIDNYAGSQIRICSHEIAFRQLDALRTTSLAHLLVRDLQGTMKANGVFMPNDMSWLETYVNDLLGGRLLSQAREPGRVSRILASLIRGTMISLEMLHMCFWNEIPLDICQIVSEVQPQNIELYLSVAQLT